MASFSFDASQVAPQDSFSLLPAGSYIAQIEESEIKATKAGTGQMLKLKWRVVDGQYANRVLFQQINIVNQNPKAEEIGQRQLSSLCHAVGVLKLNDTAQLHAKPVKIKVKIRVDDTGKYDDQNEVTSFESAAGTTAAAHAAVAAAPAAASVPPWQKRAA